MNKPTLHLIDVDTKYQIDNGWRCSVCYELAQVMTNGETLCVKHAKDNQQGEGELRIKIGDMDVVELLNTSGGKQVDETDIEIIKKVNEANEVNEVIDVLNLHLEKHSIVANHELEALKVLNQQGGNIFKFLSDCCNAEVFRVGRIDVCTACNKFRESHRLITPDQQGECDHKVEVNLAEVPTGKVNFICPKCGEVVETENPNPPEQEGKSPRKIVVEVLKCGKDDLYYLFKDKTWTKMSEMIMEKL